MDNFLKIFLNYYFIFYCKNILYEKISNLKKNKNCASIFNKHGIAFVMLQNKKHPKVFFIINIIAQRDDQRARAPKQMYYVSAAVGHLFEQHIRFFRAFARTFCFFMYCSIILILKVILYLHNYHLLIYVNIFLPINVAFLK